MTVPHSTQTVCSLWYAQFNLICRNGSGAECVLACVFVWGWVGGEEAVALQQPSMKAVRRLQVR